MDLDGTLIDHDGHLRERDRQAMDKAASSGIALAIVTGRRRSTFWAERARFSGLAFRSSVSNGAVLLSPDNRGIERVHAISWQGLEAVWAELPRDAVRACMAVTVPGTGDAACAEAPDAIIMTPDRRFYGAVSACEPEMQPAEEEFRLDEVLVTARPLVHAAFHVPDLDMVEQVAETARNCFDDNAMVYVTRPPQAGGMMVEIVARGGKALAVRDFATMLGVPDEAVAAIGDDLNDVPMLEAARFRYAMGGSRLAAAQSPGAIEMPAGGGVADALERFAQDLR